MFRPHAAHAKALQQVPVRRPDGGASNLFLQKKKKKSQECVRESVDGRGELAGEERRGEQTSRTEQAERAQRRLEALPYYLSFRFRKCCSGWAVPGMYMLLMRS